MTDSITFNDLPLGVEVRHLATLDAVARTRSFSAAANELGYAQSAVSQQIAALERLIGHQLVVRPGGPKPVSLTAAGEILLRHGAQITARLAAAKAELDALAMGDGGTLRVGTFQSASARLLPPTLARFRKARPGVSVELHNESDGPPIADLLRMGRLDLGFIDVTDIDDSLAFEALATDPYVLITAIDHPLAAFATIDLRQLEGEPQISYSMVDACSVRLERLWVRLGIQPNVMFRSDDNLTSQRLVSAGLGVAVMPRLAVELGVPDCPVAMIPLSPEQHHERKIGLAWNPDLYRIPASQAFVEVAVDVARNWFSAAGATSQAG